MCILYMYYEITEKICFYYGLHNSLVFIQKRFSKGSVDIIQKFLVQNLM